jgi:arylsulfatase A-like enzyme
LTRVGLLVGLGLSLLGAFSCAPGAERPHVILISIDTLRADHVGCYGYDRPTTPAIDALALESIRFENAISQAGWTLPSHMSLMTSLMPSQHGVTQERALNPAIVTLAESLQNAGYTTAGFASWIYVSENYGFGQGFDEYRTLVDTRRLDVAGGGGAFPAGRVVDAVQGWLSRRGDDPVFLFVHLFDPHMDYVPPGEYAEMFAEADPPSIDGRYETLKRYIRGLNESPASLSPRELHHVESLYDGEIRYVDSQIEELLASLDASLGLGNCHLILLSDHGEEFMDHGSIEGHGWTLYEEVVHVPLLWRLPAKARGGGTVAAPVGLIDVAPTLLDYLQIDAPEAFRGKSRRTAMEGDESPGYVLSENDRFNIEMRVLRGERYKLIHTADSGRNAAGVPILAGFELYDLVKDPAEAVNLYDPEDGRSHALVALLEASSGEAGAGVQNPAAELSEEQLELLRSLGYVQ